MGIFSKKEEFSYTLSIGLKSSSIDVQLIKLFTNQKREVILSDRNILYLQDSQDPTLYTQTYVKELESLLKRYQTTVHQLTEGNSLSVSIILYAPWFTTQFDTLFFKEKVTLNEEFILAELKKNKPTTPNLRILERNILKIQTNGYTIFDIEDIECENVTIDTYTSFISQDIYKTINQTIVACFPKTKKINYKTSPLLFAESIGRYMIHEDNEIFINVTGEITEVGIIEEDALVQYATFPIGIHDFLRALEANIKTYDYDALYQKQILPKSEQDKRMYEQISQNWTQSLVHILTYSKKHVPNKLILFTHNKTSDFFTDLLIKISKDQSNTLFNSYRIIHFDISLLKDIIAYKTPLGEKELDLQLEALI